LLHPFSRRNLPESFVKTLTHVFTTESSPSLWGEILLKDDFGACTPLFGRNFTDFLENGLLGGGVGVVPESPGQLWHRLRAGDVVGETGSLSEVVESTLAHRDAKLVAYNGERWNGGFDLPFLRTRLCYHEIGWPFTGLPYIDAMDVFETRFNTSGDTLTAVYEELIGSGLTELDPFVDSEEAVDAWQEGDFESLVRHNVADIRRTRSLMRLAERYCSKSDFSMKSLDPVV
jgi:hypothetical protein